MGVFFQAHYEHNFSGFILDKIPVIRHTGWQLALGAKYLSAQGSSDYYELHAGLDNIGIHLFRLFRFDVVYANDGNDGKWGYRIGVKL